MSTELFGMPLAGKLASSHGVKGNPFRGRSPHPQGGNIMTMNRYQESLADYWDATERPLASAGQNCPTRWVLFEAGSRVGSGARIQEESESLRQHIETCSDCKRVFETAVWETRCERLRECSRDAVREIVSADHEHADDAYDEEDQLSVDLSNVYVDSEVSEELEYVYFIQETTDGDRSELSQTVVAAGPLNASADSTVLAAAPALTPKGGRIPVVTLNTKEGRFNGSRPLPFSAVRIGVYRSHETLFLLFQPRSTEDALCCHLWRAWDLAKSGRLASTEKVTERALSELFELWLTDKPQSVDWIAPGHDLFLSVTGCESWIRLPWSEHGARRLAFALTPSFVPDQIARHCGVS